MSPNLPLFRVEVGLRPTKCALLALCASRSAAAGPRSPIATVPEVHMFLYKLIYNRTYMYT